jgi:ABC-type spermidine/putrescine transport system permease subunit II
MAGRVAAGTLLPPHESVRERLRHAGPAIADRIMTGVSVLAYLFLYVPIVALVVFSFDRSLFSASWTGFTWGWYITLFHDAPLLAALRVSLIVGICSAALSTVIALLASLALASGSFRGRTAFMALLFLPLLLPEIVLAVAFLTLVSHAGITPGYGSLIAGHLVLTLPFATLLLLGATIRIDKSLEEAATDLGCTPVGAFWRVTLRSLLPAIFGALLLSFTVSFEDVIMSNFVSGPGTTPLPVYVYGLLKTGVSPEINALGTLLVIGTLLIVAAIGVRQVASGITSQAARPGRPTASK